MSVMVNLTWINYGTYGEVINTVVLVFFTLIMFLFPFVMTIALSVKFDALSQPGVQKRFGYLYENLNLYQGRIAVISIPLLFLLRRLLTCASVVYQSNFIIQFLTLYLGVVAQFGAIGLKPFIDD